ncbi:MAG: response regulator [Candidatus Moranbacteria bacterium]|jgi:CheY-like chemotaxis protein|nr:response regulator [Candidatus Moranbacteria bacterium]
MSNKKKRILVVDDEMTILEIFKAFFEERWEVAIASNGKEALSKIESENFNAIILDVGMPTITGLDICKLAIGEYPGIEKKIILITGYISEECLNFSKQHKILCIQKPVFLNELECTLSKMH